MANKILSTVIFLLALGLGSSIAQSHLEVGMGVPIQQFEVVGGLNQGTSNFDFTLELGYIFRFRQFSISLSSQYINISNEFRDLNLLPNIKYQGQMTLLRINPNIGYQFVINAKQNKILLEPLFGIVPKDLLLSYNYKRSGVKTTHWKRPSNPVKIFPTYGFRIGYLLSSKYAINIKGMFASKIQQINNSYDPSIFVKQADASVQLYFSTLLITLTRKL